MEQQQEPHWIVSNREDGTNVNDWHWVERDCLPFVRSTLQERAPRGYEPCEGVKIDSLPEVSGEATANNRRGKAIFLYELEFTFRVSVPGGHTATVTFPYVGEDNEDDDYEVKVSCGSSDARDATRANAAGPLRAVVRDVIAAMKAKYTKTTKRQPASGVPSGASSASTSPAPGVAPAPAPAPSSAGSCIEMEERFTNASPRELWECLLDPKRMTAVTGAPATIEARTGSRFELFGGAVTGEIVDLVPGERIVQSWRFNTWRPGHHSLVEITFRQAATGDTLLALKQTAVPFEDRERTEHGWRANFWDRMRAIFGYGGPSNLF
eukprot:m51a1_g2242 hypothetical protein (323) ;mRNA; r:283612-284580